MILFNYCSAVTVVEMKDQTDGLQQLVTLRIQHLTLCLQWMMCEIRVVFCSLQICNAIGLGVFGYAKPANRGEFLQKSVQVPSGLLMNIHYPFRNLQYVRLWGITSSILILLLDAVFRAAEFKSESLEEEGEGGKVSLLRVFWLL